MCKRKKGQAKLLGDCTLELTPLMASLTDVHGMGVRQYLAFTRRGKNGDDVTVGRFNVVLKIVGDYVTKYG
jgi:hypothetical protein